MRQNLSFWFDDIGFAVCDGDGPETLAIEFREKGKHYVRIGDFSILTARQLARQLYQATRELEAEDSK